MKKLVMIISAILLIGAYAGGFYVVIKEDNRCKYNIELKDGTFIDASEHITNDGGMTTIRACSGNKISLPVKDIKIIKSKI